MSVACITSTWWRNSKLQEHSCRINSAAGNTVYLSGSAPAGSGSRNRVFALNENPDQQWSYTLWDGGTGAMDAPPATQSGILYFGGQKDNRLYAVNSRTKATIWTMPGVETMYASPPVIHGSSLFAFGRNAVYSVSLASGLPTWSAAARGWAAKLAVWDNTVVALSWETPPTAMDRVTGRTLWRRSDLATHFSNVIAHEGRAYFGARGGRIHALDLRDGRTVWTVALPNRLSFTAVEDYEVALADGVLYAAGGVRATAQSPAAQKVLFAIDIRTGSVIWQSETASDWGRPIVANRIVYARTGRGLYPEPRRLAVLDAKSGRSLWEVDGDGLAVVANERLYVLSRPSPGASTVTAYVAREHATYPVIFVHGFKSDGHTWSSFRDRLRNSGSRYGGSPRVIVEAVKNDDPAIASSQLIPGDFYTLTFSSNDGLTFEQQGWELAKIIEEVKRVNDAGRVILVGHSMGGLAARAYLQGQARSPAGQSAPYRSDVDQLITVGTPHMGSPWPHFCDAGRGTRSLCDLFGGLAIDMLKADSRELTRLNTSSTALPSILYSSLIVEGMFLSAAGIEENGDGIVAASSQNLGSITLPRHASPHHRSIRLELDPWCAPLGAQSHICEPGNSEVQDSIVRELGRTQLASTPMFAGNSIGISATATGPLRSRTLAVTIRPLTDVYRAGAKLFVAASVGSQFYVLTRFGWRAWSGGALPAYSESLAPSQSVRVFDGDLDLTPYRDANIYVGYGSTDTEMLERGRYALVHTLH